MASSSKTTADQQNHDTSTSSSRATTQLTQMPSFSSFPSFATAPAFPAPSEPPHRTFTQPSRSRDRSPYTTSDDDTEDSHAYIKIEKRKRKQSRDPSRERDQKRKRKQKNRKKKHRTSIADSQFTFDKTPKGKGQLIVETKEFFTDRKGDKQNVAFESSHRYAIPKYKRWGESILGESNGWKIDHRATKKSKHVQLYRWDSIESTHGLGKVRYQDFKRVLREKPIHIEKLLADVPKPDPTTDQLDYIPIPISHAVGTELSRRDHDTETLHEDSEFVEKTAQFNKRLQEESKDPSLWLEFIRLQDELLKDKESKGNLLRAVNEKKQTIYEKALQEIPANEELLSGYMSCCQELWEAPRLLTKWDQVLKRNTHSIRLWKQYLDFRQSNYSTFTVFSCIELYENCIDIMMKDTTTVVTRREEILLHIFTRACFMLAQAGFTERAVALYQAMIEFSCFCPQAFLGQTFQQRLGMFENFWDSEVPRFGEEGSRGWSGSLLEEPDSLRGASVDENGSDMSVGEDELERWLNAETRAEYSNWLPLRSAGDDEELEDPFRTVLFDDIRTLMFYVSLESSKRHLLYSFLQFLAVPFNGGISSNHSFFQESFVHAEFADPLASEKFWPPRSLLAIERSGIHTEQQRDAIQDTFRVPLKSFPQTINNVFSTKKWFCLWGPDDADIVRGQGAGRHQFIRNVLQQSHIIISQDSQLLPLLLSIESGFSPKNAQKAAKTMLKTERMNLSLWNAYAQIEVAKGNIPEARKVYLTALMSYRTFPKERQIDIPLLYQKLADLEVDAKQPERALNILCAYATDEPVSEKDDEKPTPIRILRARKAYASLLDPLLNEAPHSVIDHKAQSLLNVLGCYGLFEYLSQGLEEAQFLYDRVLNMVMYRCAGKAQSNPGVVEEAIYEEYARLLYRHAVSGSAYKPGVLRELLERALEQFPSNTMFLALYGWNEARAKIENRVRRLLDTQLTSKPSHILWTFAIWAELHQRQTYNVNLVRSLFERAVECPTSRHSASLWHLYIQFEIRGNNMHKAKSLFFRAIRECPWNKALYLLPFRLLRDVYDEDELMEIITLLEEKELRIRHNISVE